jgi:hypothetical protein
VLVPNNDRQPIPAKSGCEGGLNENNKSRYPQHRSYAAGENNDLTQGNNSLSQGNNSLSQGNNSSSQGNNSLSQGNNDYQHRFA